MHKVFLSNMNETHLITHSSRMADVVNANPAVLSVLDRLGIRLGFHEATVEDICNRYGLSTHLFLDVCNIYCNKHYEPRSGQLSGQDISKIISYLQTSHKYYSTKSLPALHHKIHRLLAGGNESNAAIINKFYDDYLEEITRHFRFEEEVVFPGVKNLLAEHGSPSQTENFSTGTFEENHSNIEDKLSDLKNTILKYLPDDYPQSLRMEILKEIYAIAEDLDKHTRIEDKLLVPAITGLIGNSPAEEDPKEPHPQEEAAEEEDEQNHGPLSEREKEIVAEVAKGLTNKEIADRLHLSIHTVTTHRKNISHKTGINSISGITVYAIINHLVDINDL